MKLFLETFLGKNSLYSLIRAQVPGAAHAYLPFSFSQHRRHLGGCKTQKTNQPCEVTPPRGLTSSGEPHREITISSLSSARGAKVAARSPKKNRNLFSPAYLITASLHARIILLFRPLTIM